MDAEDHGKGPRSNGGVGDVVFGERVAEGQEVGPEGVGTPAAHQVYLCFSGVRAAEAAGGGFMAGVAPQNVEGAV